MRKIFQRLPQALSGWVGPNARQFAATNQIELWIVALLSGICVSFAAIAFREAIGLVQWTWLFDRSENVATAARAMPWWVRFSAPIVGGLVVGGLIVTLLPSRRPGGVADVMEAKAMGGRNVRFRQGLSSAVVNATSLGFGGSAGREGPIVHLGAAISSSFAARMELQNWSRRTLLACGVASAVSASFNAPIAGVLFAHEVILGHYAMRSFVPIVISSVAGTILSRQWFGEDAAFSVPDYTITSYFEFPAFALLGAVCAFVALLFQLSLVGADYLSREIAMPLWLRPAAGGVLLGLIAVWFPEVLGVGYEAIDETLKGEMALWLMFSLIFFKTIATAITLASRWGGGVFSPALYLGAMTGGTFAAVAGSLFPNLASDSGVYAILGMGAVAAAVLGAPISTTVMVFELTGGYAITIALLLSVSISVGINQALNGRSWFQYQLETRGLNLRDGPHGNIARQLKVMDYMDPLPPDEQETFDPEQHGGALRPDQPYDQSLRAFDETGRSRLPVLDPQNETQVIAWATHVRALRTYNRALVRMSEEEHR